jgi:hypothetical protein
MSPQAQHIVLMTDLRRRIKKTGPSGTDLSLVPSHRRPFRIIDNFPAANQHGRPVVYWAASLIRMITPPDFAIASLKIECFGDALFSAE